MNQEKHWNKIASDYDDEIFDVFRSDKKKILQRYFRKHADKTKRAIDFGCGIGKAFEYLAPSFNEVLAIDISQECIDIAKENQYNNIEYKRLDLTKPRLNLKKGDFALCCNVIILPEPENNVKIIRNIFESLNPGGVALFVMPSMDSILHYAWRLIDWYGREGVSPQDIPKSEFNYFKDKISIFQGIIDIRGVKTKHYSYPEIETIFPEVGFKLSSIERIEYDWETEFSSPPKWMKDPYPWDWLVEVKK